MEALPVYGISEFLKEKNKQEFYSNTLHVHLLEHKFINVPHKHSTYIAVLFVSGSGKHQIDFDTFMVRPGSIFLLSPGQVHNWKLSQDAKGYVFFHDKGFYDDAFAIRKLEDFPFFYLQKNYPVIYLKKDQLKNCEQLFRQIHTEFCADLPFRSNKLIALVDQLYIDLARIYDRKEQVFEGSHSAYLKVKTLRKMIDENFLNKKFPGDYAEMMHMSTRHLSRLCQQMLHMTTSDLIIDRIVTEAKRILINQDLSISMVAYALGYEDVSYFTRLFKKKTGTSPKEFQKLSIQHGILPF